MKVLVVEDEDLIAEFLRRSLKSEHYEVDIATDGLSGQTMAINGDYNVIVLDVMLPMKNGVDVCREVRRQGVSTPIIFLTARTSETAKVQGLDAGADDYLVKPFSHKELNARIRALTRRQSMVLQSELCVGDLKLSPVSREVYRKDQKISLRPKEYLLLEYLMRNPGVALSRNKILCDVWGVSRTASSNRLDVCIKQLRDKIDIAYPDLEQLIETIPSFGYKLKSD